jgi:hypothetical protein
MHLTIHVLLLGAIAMGAVGVRRRFPPHCLELMHSRNLEPSGFVRR